MGLLSKLGFGKAAAAVENPVASAAEGVISAIGAAGDRLFTSDAERAQWAVVMKKVEQEPQIMQAMITAMSTASGNSFVASARSAVLYLMGISVFYGVVIRDVLVMTLGIKPENVPKMPVESGLLLRYIGSLLGINS